MGYTFGMWYNNDNIFEEKRSLMLSALQMNQLKWNTYYIYKSPRCQNNVIIKKRHVPLC